MKKVCPRDGIGRHAWLKTTSLWGPGSSPGVGIISEFFRDIKEFFIVHIHAKDFMKTTK